MTVKLTTLHRNTNGTNNFQNRIQKFQINLKLAPNASAQNPSKPNLRLKYLDSILLHGPDGQPVTSLDASSVTSSVRRSKAEIMSGASGDHKCQHCGAGFRSSDDRR